LPNPFFYGGHVQPESFVGRKAELRRIFSALDTAHTGQLQSISVVGPRRIGKSSLLFYVAHRFAQHLTAPKNYRFTYVELPSAECRTLDGLVTKILRDLGANGNKKQPPLVRFESAINALRANGIYPVVCVDEFEELTDHRDEFPHDVYDSWRALINNHAIAFITASKSPLCRWAN
jgi:predicted ATPase